MEWPNIDPTLLGVIVGSVLSLAGNLVGQWFSTAREEKHWKRQRSAEKEDRGESQKLEEIKRVSDIYGNCLTRLAIFNSIDNNDTKLNEDEYNSLYQETVSWVNQLKLHLRDEYCKGNSDFKKWVDHFSISPTSWADNLTKEIHKQMTSDGILFPDAKPTKETKVNLKRIQVSISDSFRREEIIKGRELKKIYLLESDLGEFSETQRGLLWEMYFIGNQRIPEHVQLCMPIYVEMQNIVNLLGPQWEAEINPETNSIQEVLHEWEIAYKNTLERETNKIKAVNK